MRARFDANSKSAARPLLGACNLPPVRLCRQRLSRTAFSNRLVSPFASNIRRSYRHLTVTAPGRVLQCVAEVMLLFLFSGISVASPESVSRLHKTAHHPSRLSTVRRSPDSITWPSLCTQAFCFAPATSLYLRELMTATDTRKLRSLWL